jgi:hypothetical protein
MGWVFSGHTLDSYWKDYSLIAGDLFERYAGLG